jgi:poly-beta-1,6-N-acetyl-D-glucosamine synthase
MNGQYVIISPVRNEAQFLPATIASVTAQTALPRAWFLVNDGSTDETAQIIEDAASRYSWIRPLHRVDRGVRRAGSGVMEAFNQAYALLRGRQWDFLVKLDGDLSFSAEYFARCLAEFEAESRLGIGSGLVCTPAKDGYRGEFDDPPFHVRGPAKMYRRECWEEIGGLVAAPGWDTLDLIKANMAGWRTRTFPEITLLHHRPTGGAYGTWSNWKKNGLANYLVGYHPLFMLAKCARRTFRRPYGIAALGLWCGFCRGYLDRVKRPVDESVMKYLREQQIRCLLGQANLWS